MGPSLVAEPEEAQMVFSLSGVPLEIALARCGWLIAESLPGNSPNRLKRSRVHRDRERATLQIGDARTPQ